MVRYLGQQLVLVPQALFRWVGAELAQVVGLPAPPSGIGAAVTPIWNWG